jgi:hypothetical protein
LTIGLSGYEGRGSREGQMRLRLNGGTIGRIDGMKGDSSIHRCGASGLYRQHEVRFDAASLRPGANILTIELPPPSRIPRQALAVPLSAVLWDCLQMEVERPDR